MTRSVLLANIGIIPLPDRTPVQRKAASWVPTVYTAPPTPVPEGFEATAIVHGILLVWHPVQAPDVIYVLERAPDVGGVPGAWSPLMQSSEATRYTYNDATAQTSWFRLHAVSRGLASEYAPPVSAKPLTQIEDGRVDELQEQLTATVEALQTLDTRVVNTEEVNAAQAAALTHLSASLEDTNGKVVANADAVSELGTRVTNAEGTITVQAQEITAVKTSLSGGGNLIVNSAFETSLYGWDLYSDDGQFNVVARDLLGDDGHPLGVHSVGMSAPGTVPGAMAMIASSRSIAVAVQVGRRYCFSAYVASRGCDAGVFAQTIDESGDTIDFQTDVQDNVEFSGGKYLENWRLSSVIFTATRSCRAIGGILATARDEADPVAWLCMPMFEEMSPGQIGPSLWSPSAVGMDDSMPRSPRRSRQKRRNYRMGKRHCWPGLRYHWMLTAALSAGRSTTTAKRAR
jgi:hypothetical protein